MTNTKKSILVVEDNPTVALANKIIFKKLGCEVEHVIDGDEALEMVKKNHFDAVSMDVGLPTISGTEVCKAIRDYEAKNNLSPLVIIAVTGNNSPQEEEEYLRAGMQAVISKPLSIEKAEYFLSFL